MPRKAKTSDTFPVLPSRQTGAWVVCGSISLLYLQVLFWLYNLRAPAQLAQPAASELACVEVPAAYLGYWLDDDYRPAQDWSMHCDFHKFANPRTLFRGPAEAVARGFTGVLKFGPLLNATAEFVVNTTDGAVMNAVLVSWYTNRTGGITHAKPMQIFSEDLFADTLQRWNLGGSNDTVMCAKGLRVNDPKVWPVLTRPCKTGVEFMMGLHGLSPSSLMWLS